MKNYFKKANILFNVILLLNCFIITSVSAAVVIEDPMLLKALNNVIKEEVPGRSDQQQISDEDVKYVYRLDASNMGITDILGLEKFTNIYSTIDLSDNNITDITPLINWAKNKGEDLNANIFLGGNSGLLENNYNQIYELSSISDKIRIYDSQRAGEGVIELPGFYKGRPAQDLNFDEISYSSKGLNITSVSQDNIDIDNNVNQDVVNTGLFTLLIYIFSFIISVFIFSYSFYMQKKKEV